MGDVLAYSAPFGTDWIEKKEKRIKATFTNLNPVYTHTFSDEEAGREIKKTNPNRSDERFPID